jgi:hypothetical protein
MVGQVLGLAPEVHVPAQFHASIGGSVADTHSPWSAKVSRTHAGAYMAGAQRNEVGKRAGPDASRPGSKGNGH